MTDKEKAEELTQEYFQRFGGFTCSWGNVQQIISEMLKENEELKNEIDELKALHESDKKATALLMQKWEAERNELKKDKEWLDNTNNEQTKVILCRHRLKK